MFVIRNQDYVLTAGTPLKIRFFVNYNPLKTPSLEMIKLNGKVVCIAQKNKPLNVRQTDNSLPVETVQTSKPQTSSSNARPNNTNSASEWLDVRNLNSLPIGAPPSQSITKLSNCGTIAATAAPLISHGQETFPGQWPWHAALYHFQDVQINYECGASLITEQHVITAAHCVTLLRTKTVKNPSDILISLGKYSLKQFDEHLQDRGVSTITIHPKYDPFKFHNDIAVLKLSAPVELTNFVRPGCLWEETSDLDDIVDKEGIVVGWGLNEHKKHSYTLTQAKLPVASIRDCLEELYPYLSSGNYCAGLKNGTTVCQGDSGGAMVFPRKDAEGQIIWQIRGIVSLSLNGGIGNVCDKSHYKLFTDVAKYTRWIKEVIDK